MTFIGVIGAGRVGASLSAALLSSTEARYQAVPLLADGPQTGEAKSTRLGREDRVFRLHAHVLDLDDLAQPLLQGASHEQLLQHAEAIQEHRAVELAVLPDIHAAEVGSRQFAGSALVLSEFVDHHAKEEEKEMFKSARELFSKEELAEFDEQYEEWKASNAAAAVQAQAQIKTAARSMARDPSAPA